MERRSIAILQEQTEELQKRRVRERNRSGGRGRRKSERKRSNGQKEANLKEKNRQGK